MGVNRRSLRKSYIRKIVVRTFEIYLEGKNKLCQVKVKPSFSQSFLFVRKRLRWRDIMIIVPFLSPVSLSSVYKQHLYVYNYFVAKQ